MALKSKWFLLSVFAVQLMLVGSLLGQEESLLIGPGDVIHISFFDTPELEQHVHVTDAGDVTLLLGAKVHVANLTPAQAAASIEEALRNGGFMNHPKASVLVEAYATESVYVLGEVRSPGPHAVGTPQSVLSVLSMSGGLTELADRKVLIERRGTKEKVPYFLSNNADTAVDSEIKIKKLIWKFPKNLPFLQGYYSSDSLRIDKRDIGITWHALVFVKGKFDFADISFLPTTLSVSKNDLNGTDPDTVGMRKLLQAWSMDSSPVHKIKKAVEVRFYYNNAQN